MITLFRIDERLIHGQVIATWLKTAGISHLVVANDDAAHNGLQQKALKLAVPNTVKCLIKGIPESIQIVNDPRCEKMRIMLIVGSPQDALKLIDKVPEITEVNLANYGSITKPDVPNKLAVSNMVYLDQDDIAAVNELVAFGKPVFTQKTPSEIKKVINKL